MAKTHKVHKKAAKHHPPKHSPKHVAHHAKKSVRHAKHKSAHHKARKTAHHAKQHRRHARASKEPQPFKDVIHTELDEIVFIVEERGRISLKELSKKLNMPLNQVERWCERLAEHGLLKLNYPLVGRTYLLSVQPKQEAAKPIVDLQKPEAPKIKKKRKGIPRNMLILILALILLGAAVFIVLRAARGG